MKITIDREADALYIEFSNGEFGKNRKIDDDTIIDLDRNGNILGIEILNISRRLNKDFLSDIRVRNLVSD